MANGEGTDVIVVGARCAGAPVAALLARRGLRVVVLEQAVFPRNTLSSHTVQTDGLAFLDRLGLTRRLRATGAPYLSRMDCRLEDLRFTAAYPQRPGDVGGAVNVRRHVLDTLLADTAAEFGADVRMGHQVTGLLRDGDRVAGVEVRAGGRRFQIRAPLVIGADGRASTVARLVGAPAYHVLAGERSYYWTYFAGVDAGPDPAFIFHRWGDRFLLGAPTDSGLYLVGVSPEAHERDAFRRDTERYTMDHARSCPPIAELIAGATRADRIYGIRRFTGYFRQAAGPGWMLLGDAGHFKDPAAGRGIGDAFRQVEALVPALLDAWDDGPAAVDRALGRYGRWRDRTHVQHFFMGADLGCAGPVSPLVPELVGRLHAQRRTDLFLDLLSHRVQPSRVLTVPRVLGAANGLLRRSDDRRGVLREVARLVGTEAGRRWRAHRPIRADDPEPAATTRPAVARMPQNDAAKA